MWMWISVTVCSVTSMVTTIDWIKLASQPLIKLHDRFSLVGLSVLSKLAVGATQRCEDGHSYQYIRIIVIVTRDWASHCLVQVWYRACSLSAIAPLLTRSISDFNTNATLQRMPCNFSFRSLAMSTWRCSCIASSLRLSSASGKNSQQSVTHYGRIVNQKQLHHVSSERLRYSYS